MVSNLEHKLYAIEKQFSFKGHPVFRLNAVRRKYLNIFIDEIISKNIKLKHINACLCGSHNLRKVAYQDRFGLPFVQFICEDCGILNTSPKIDDSSIEDYYKRIYHPLVVGIESGESNTYSFSDEQGNNIFNFLKKNLLASGANKINIIEIGCAAGDNLISLEARLKKCGIKASIFGSEYQSDLVKIAKSKGIKIIDRVEDLLSSSVRFDLVIMSHVFEHLSNPNIILDMLKKIINNDGILYIEVPGIQNIEMINTYYGGDLNDYLIHAHFYNFNLNSLANYLNINGFKLLAGNEKVQSVFIVGETTNNYLRKENYKNIISCIYKHQILRINNISKISIRSIKNIIVRYFNRRNLNKLGKTEF